MLRIFNSRCRFSAANRAVSQTSSNASMHRMVSIALSLADAASVGSELVQFVIWTIPAVKQIKTELWSRPLIRTTPRLSAFLLILLAISIALFAAEVQMLIDMEE